MGKEAGGKVVKARKFTVADVIKNMENKKAQEFCPQKDPKELKCEFFKTFLAQEINKNEKRKQTKAS